MDPDYSQIPPKEPEGRLHSIESLPLSSRILLCPLPNSLHKERCCAALARARAGWRSGNPRREKAEPGPPSPEADSQTSGRELPSLQDGSAPSPLPGSDPLRSRQRNPERDPNANETACG